MRPEKRALVLVGGIAVLVIAAVIARQALGRPQGQSETQAEVVWESTVPSELRAQLYESAIVPGEPRVVATSPRAIWAIDERGVFESLLDLASSEEGGESATLSADARRAGILIHQQHALSGFRLVDLGGKELASVESQLQFHYRLAPGGDSFVGIDAEGEHIQTAAGRFLYTFYDETGQVTGQVESEGPQSMDSAYAADGRSFLVNNAGGLSAYAIANGELLWSISKPARFFAAGDTPSQLVVVSDEGERNVVEAYRAGELLWTSALGRNVRNLASSPSGQFMLATDGDTAHFFVAGGQEPRWSFPMPDEGLAINSAAVNDAGVVALGAQHRELKGGLVIILDADGREMFARELSYELSNAWIPGVQFDLNGAFVLVRTLEELLLIGTE